ncbi:bifunctional 2-polyprenyl-6-hydroxyphenol methylase/3-demethylubiquinol 3-O-methyltransferase UbiG [Parvularcula sp. LCG005]|uniref:bifunctional 2-polyprenyl-6-hydroxyphenol methylase/3-demethylubiquinol 3-O-methyltransferase UbiG n=1 Tax=Parvularcula sp. LCG005 TaxID=3078805 RepID=UPI00294295C3|nr:bifunctional 2-polyprenyl-6-hydroxyphenol methylase/3-demethylubiquinol 3-O-methyltransferase UbiG [Parvularcula sp. LCG005]WOI54142.1 bifunctional 2-polyprenyl-6-hydroxyphenol methylase/3-demethylubiquinol 3-O-methyltransferase UbiG [Parvularcula sp. LCG005]
MTGQTTIDPAEVDKFSKMAAEWWDPTGKFKPLHKFNPVRLTLIKDRICGHFGLDRTAKKPLEGLRLLDIGCGGGLVSEPMRRLGATVVGIDAAERNVKTAMAHAMEHNVDIDYRHTTVEDLVASGEAPFDVVLNLEVVEHVADINLFLGESAALVKSGGMMGVATINRTAKALLTAKIGAEYVLRWLPPGTHDPRKFVKPSEVRKALETAGLKIESLNGVSYQPFADAWKVTEDMSVNYMMFASRPPLA